MPEVRGGVDLAEAVGDHPPRDLDHGGRRVRLVWRKRRWRCREPRCKTRTFTEAVPAVPARARLTTRLRSEAGAAVGDANRTVAQAGRDLGVSWPVVMEAFAAHAKTVLPERFDPVPVLGTRYGGASPRGGGTRRPDPGSWSPTGGTSASSTSAAGRASSARSRAATRRPSSTG